ncbi:MarR family winged helix-turn-helix transcriptional regulator [Lentilactobacillus laojiaonis]|uniref:MarR family winged helix-turn-helix transcriptional regulator n=1 Tax=Lentilactobacillus laojiaonis TaxID=2883998 RepID=UPI001D0AB670|nr:MarR family transcriptional regulator [Lentilactobacillus laojiaonis]UDM32018.1 MarR family transcriptional regulator [Lentilactobacillus laojiaonis]
MAFGFDQDRVQGINIIARIIQNDLNRSLKPYDLKANNYFYILFLLDHPGSSQDDLTRIMFLDHSTITRSVAKLIKLGYIYRQDDPDDKRASRLYVTDAGKKLIPILSKLTEHAEEVALGNLSHEQRDIIQSLLITSAKAHEKEKKNAKQ